MTAMASPSSASNRALPTLTVTVGLHRGVSLVLDEPSCSIGSGASASLVLGDSGIADEHLRLRFAGRQLIVEATGGDVAVIDEGREIAVERGHGYRARFPLEITLGQARIRLAGPEADAPAPPVWYGKPQWLVAALFMLVCAGAVAMLQERPQPASPSRIGPAAEAPIAADQSPSLEEIRADLAQRAAASGLGDVSFVVDDGQLFARGSYAPERQAAWIALQRHFDSRYASRHLLHRNVAAEALEADPQVKFQAVWLGENPYVINASGDRLFPGAPLADGWVIERIAADQILLARGARRFALTLD